MEHVDPRSRFALLALLCGVAACFDLPPIEERCGNHVVETSRGEACDVEEAEGAPTLCAVPGDAHECQYVSDDDHECPTGYREGADGLCSRPSGAFGSASQPRREISGVNARAGDLDADGQLDVVVDTPDLESAAALYLQRSDAGYEVETQALSSALGAVADLSGDGASDIATTTKLFGVTPDSVVVLRGRTDRDLQPKIYTRDVYPGDIRYAALPAAAAGSSTSRAASKGCSRCIATRTHRVEVRGATASATRTARRARCPTSRYPWHNPSRWARCTTSSWS